MKKTWVTLLTLAWVAAVQAQLPYGGFFAPPPAAAAPSPFLLDVIATNHSSAKAGWNLSSTNTRPLYRFRDSVGNVETDFYQGATVGSLNTVLGGGGSDILTVYPGGLTNAFMVRWYDQVNPALDCVQATAASQPIFIKGGAFVFTQNGIPCAAFTNAFLTVTNGNAYAAPAHYQVLSAASATAPTTQYMGIFHPDNISTGFGLLMHAMTGQLEIARANSARWQTSALAAGTPYLISAGFDGATDTLFKNAAADQNSVSDSGYGTNPSATGTGYNNSTAQGWTGWINCVVVWSQALGSADNLTAETTVNNVLKIY